MSPGRAFEYKGRMIYPLFEPKDDKNHPCTGCIFEPSGSQQCNDVRWAVPNSALCHDGKIGYIWGEGEEAALQHLTERLVS